ncbi:MAG: C10 family peptidase [Bacteroidales bacterium]|nr:C10 family peptidase [Bacteroidales bacterium]
MNNIFLFLGLTIPLLFIQPMGLAQRVSQQEASQVASAYLLSRNPGLLPGDVKPLLSNHDTLAWLLNCEPQGFLITAAERSLPPIIAWSEEGNFGEGEAWASFYPLLIYDLKTRKTFIDPGSSEALKNRQLWRYWNNPRAEVRDYQQWPPEGWSSTGGWLFTNWTQSAPYNALCPIDGQTQQRSVAGCPATAMAQILNFHHRTNGTRFDDADDYYHSYGAGNSYWIDNDWETRGFPSWDQLNVYLDTLEAHYAGGVVLSNTDKAALTYACGAAAKQVYSSSGSGTYGVDQAYNAYLRFGYSDARLDGPLNPELNLQLAQNIMLALPAHLALVNPEWTVGHNVVVDGYSTDDLYHFNFGWGGSANGWYTMPPADIPYDLTVIEGLVLDINLSNPPVGFSEATQTKQYSTLFYNEECNCLFLHNEPLPSGAVVRIFDQSGRLVQHSQLPSGSVQQSMAVKELPVGLYIAVIVSADGGTAKCKFVR